MPGRDATGARLRCGYVHRIKREAEQQGIEPERRQGVLPLYRKSEPLKRQSPCRTMRIQPTGPDGGVARVPRTYASPPIEAVAMPTERELGCTTSARGASTVQ